MRQLFKRYAPIAIETQMLNFPISVVTVASKKGFIRSIIRISTSLAKIHRWHQFALGMLEPQYSFQPENFTVDLELVAAYSSTPSTEFLTSRQT